MFRLSFRQVTQTSLIAASLSLMAANAQAGEAVSTGTYDEASVGFVLSDFQGDFNYGVEARSPWFFHSLAVQAVALQSWYEHGVDDAGNQTWLQHSSYKLGLMGGSVTANKFLRMYGAGGVLVVLPNNQMSTKKSVTGGYGTFGFEFLSGHSVNYLIELGTNGIEATADKLPGKPLYDNGFVTTVGLRYYL